MLPPAGLDTADGVTPARAKPIGGHAHAAESHIKSIHGSGFCNLNYFLCEAQQMAKDDNVIPER